MGEYTCVKCGNSGSSGKEFEVMQNPQMTLKAVMCKECGDIWKVDIPHYLEIEPIFWR